MTSLAEEIGVAGIGQLDGHTRTIGIGLHHQLEVVLLSSTGRQLGVNVELALPLAATHTLGQGNLVGVTLVGSYGLYGQLAPTVVGKPVSHRAAYRTIVYTTPQVFSIVVVQNDGLLEINLANLDMRAGR